MCCCPECPLQWSLRSAGITIVVLGNGLLVLRCVHYPAFQSATVGQSLWGLLPLCFPGPGEFLPWDYVPHDPALRCQAAWPQAVSDQSGCREVRSPFSVLSFRLFSDWRWECPPVEAGHSGATCCGGTSSNLRTSNVVIVSSYFSLAYLQRWGAHPSP